MVARGAGVIVSTQDLAEVERCAQAAFLIEGRVVAVGTPEQVTYSARVVVSALSGVEKRLLAQRIDAIPGVIACYPQGASRRIIVPSRYAGST